MTKVGSLLECKKDTTRDMMNVMAFSEMNGYYFLTKKTNMLCKYF